LGFAVLGFSKAAWFGYAFFAGLMGLYALIITLSHGSKKKRREDQT